MIKNLFIITIMLFIFNSCKTVEKSFDLNWDNPGFQNFIYNFENNNLSN
jgi:hypothetical protein